MLGDRKSPPPELPSIPRLDVGLPNGNGELLPLLSNPSPSYPANLPLPRIPSDASLPTPETSNVSPVTSGNVTPITPISPGGFPKAPKKTNPLVDLIDTETAYVELLGGIIRKVAAAWSRSNLPPHQLDAVFRSIEVVYKANRALLSKLNEIGPKPSSPKALGDLLMRWIEDLDIPYTRYSRTYVAGFDDWQVIQDNPKLTQILLDYSQAKPPILLDQSSTKSLWTLDSLLMLPRSRIKYYKRLYGRLLKSTSPGRSDYELLRSANEKLDDLIQQLDSRASMKVGDHQDILPSADSDILTNDMTRLSVQSESQSSIASGQRSSRETAHTSLGQVSSMQAISTQLDTADIERSVMTEETIDIFTMKPRQVKLALNPPGLTFTRQLRMASNAYIEITPRSDGIRRVHESGHVFLMTDLFLVCEKLDTKVQKLGDANLPGDIQRPEWRLCYPPLAARHLAISKINDTTLNVRVMKKEDLIVRLPSLQIQEKLLQEFESAIELACSLQPPPKPSSKGGLPLSPASLKDQATLSQSSLSRSDQMSIEASSKGAIHPGQVLLADSSVPLDRNRSSDPVQASRSQSADISIAVPQILHPQPISMSSQVPDMFTNGGPKASFVEQNHDNVPFLNLKDANGVPPRLYSAPPPGATDFFPPPRGASMVPPSTHNGLSNTVSNRPIHSAPAAEYMPSQTPFNAMQGPPVIHRPSSRASTDPSPHSSLRKALSSHSLRSQHNLEYASFDRPPPVPSRDLSMRSNLSSGSHLGPVLPSMALRHSQAFDPRNDPRQGSSPPISPIEEMKMPDGPVTSSISAQMRCKVFLKQQHAQWKSLGAARLKLYHQRPTNVKQLVVEADSKDHTLMISTIILTDGVERVGKTGVAIELSDKGMRTGIVYMIQLRGEKAASGLFDELLRGSDRTARPGG